MPRKNQWRIVLALIFSGILIILLFDQVYSFLCLSQPAEPDILVAEGWLPDDALDKLKIEFLHGHYRLLVTTGFPYNDGYPVGSGGTIEFDLNNRLINSADNQYNITVTMRGTPAKGVFPHIWLYVDSIKIGESFTTRRKKEFTFRTRLDSPPKRIRILFDNDAYTKFADRNLSLYSVMINDSIFAANDKQVAYYSFRNGEYGFIKQFGRSSAASAANYLIHAGIPDSLIIPLETDRIIKSKTYSTALDFKRWLDEMPPSGKLSVTLFSRGVHARRTYISFKKVLHQQVNLGIISSPDPYMTQSDWWKSFYGWKRMLYETSGVIYAWIIL